MKQLKQSMIDAENGEQKIAFRQLCKLYKQTHLSNFPI